MIILSILIFAVILTFIVVVHEFGHFITARLFGVLVEEFGVGFPPRLFGIQHAKRKWHFLKGKAESKDIMTTVYSVNALPIGGFVKLYGDGAGGEGGDINPKLAKYSLDAKPPIQRIAIMAAGVVMNILLAVFIYYGLLASNGFVSEPMPMIGKPNFVFGTQRVQPIIAQVEEKSAAAQAGLQSQDIVISVSRDGSAPQEIKTTEQLIEYIRSGQAPIQIKVLNLAKNTYRTVTVSPTIDPERKVPVIGVRLVNIVSVSYDQAWEKALVGWLHGFNLMSYNFQIMGSMVNQSIQSRDPSIVGDAVSGPVGIAGVVNEIIKSSDQKIVTNLLNTMAIISLSLAFINILPFPALDGGRIFMLLPELLFGKKFPKKFENYLNIAGFGLLILLSILITVKDVVKLFQ